MKIVDVIGEKVYKDGERIITQVSGDLGQPLSWKLPPVELVCLCHSSWGTHAARSSGTLPAESSEAHQCSPLASVHLS